MDIRKDSEVVKQISERTGVPKSTIYEWRKSEKKIKLFEALADLTFIETSDYSSNINDEKYLKNEILKAINQLPKGKVKEFYHLMMAELAKMGH